MANEAVRGFIGFIGLLAQTAGVVLLLVLFQLLRAHARRRAYFKLWGWAWLALSVSLIALVLRYNRLEHFTATPVADEALRVRCLYFLYQSGKLFWLTFLLAGTARFARAIPAVRVLRIGAPLACCYALVSLLVETGLSELVVWQAPVAVAVFSACAAVLIRLPPSRQSLGSRATATIFLMLACLWAAYVLAFGMVATQPGPAPQIVAVIVGYNSYFDLLLQMLLGYGMVLILLEDSKREADDAHAELAVAHDHLRRVSLHDPLTGALNRHAFSEGVGLDLARATFGSVVMLDLDNLKEINDGWGHAAGDRVLCRLVDVLRRAVRPSDRIFRWGGDEFLIVMPRAEAAVVQARLEAVIERENERGEGDGQQPSPPLQASLGAADYLGGEGLMQAIEAADRAMYDRKLQRKAAAAAAAPAAAAQPAE